MTTDNLTFASQDVIDVYEKEAELFFSQFLMMDYHACFVTDESLLSDFSSCGLPDEFPEYDSLETLYDAWDGYILNKIKTELNITYTTTNVPLLTIFSDMYLQNNNSMTLH